MKSKLLEWVKSEEGKKALKEYGRTLNRRQAAINKYHTKLETLSDKQFQKLLDEQFNQHGEKWKDKCWKNGTFPYPKQTLTKIIQVIEDFGEAVEVSGDEFFDAFGAAAFVYKGKEQFVYFLKMVKKHLGYERPACIKIKND